MTEEREAQKPGTYHRRPSPWSAGLAAKCPRCGEGKLFTGFLTVRERCAVCGLDLTKADSGDGPAIFLIFVLGFLVVPLAILVELWVRPPVWLHGILWGLFILAGALVLLRPFKGVMMALQYRNQASDSGTEHYD